MYRRSHAAILVSGLLLVGCAALKGGYAVPSRHPEDVGRGRPACSACHEAGQALAYARFDHTASFAGNHSREAAQSERVCAMCHEQSFCNDCHVARSELKPSVKNATDTYRGMPHRGDYLSRHRIDARIDPTSCFRCHGNPKASKACVSCHGKP